MINNKMYFRHTVMASGIIIALSTGASYADDTHYNNILIGERASGMGGAYTAISDDPSGLYYNPAGIVYAGGRNFTASVNAFHNTEVRYKSVIGGSDWVRNSSNLLPNFFGATQPMLGGMAGFSYAVTDSIVEDQDFTAMNPNAAVSQFTLNLNVRDNTTKIGPSFAMEFTDKFSLGLTLYAHIRDAETINNQWVTESVSGKHWWYNSYREESEIGIDPVVGIMLSPADKLSIGITLRKTFIMLADWQTQGTLMNEAALAPEPVFYPPASNSGTDKREHPFITSIGLGYFPSNKLLFSADFTYYSPTSGLKYPGTDVWLYFPREATWNAAFGAEYFPTGSWAVRGGLFTNRSNTPVVSSTEYGQEDHFDMYGFSTSLTKMTPTSSITAGLTYSRGSGDSQPYGDNIIKKVEADSLTLFLSSSYSY